MDNNNYSNGVDFQNPDYQNNGGYQNQNQGQNPYPYQNQIQQYQDEKKTKAHQQGNRVKFLFFILICALVFSAFWWLDFDLFDDLPVFQYLSYAAWILFGVDLLYVVFRKMFG